MCGILSEDGEIYGRQESPAIILLTPQGHALASS